MLQLNIKTGDAVAYVMLPRIIPRVAELGLHFRFVAYLMALLFASVGLLPKSHPFLSPLNIGTYSTRQVFFDSARNLRFHWRNIDQIIIFILLLAALILLVSQIAVLVFFFGTGIAHAAGFGSLFATTVPDNDIALMLLDRVFGVPGFFNSCISDLNILCDPTGRALIPSEPGVYPEPYQIAMQGLFAFYSFGMLAVGGLILIYFFFALFFETLQSGVPFGRRFASFYAPLRLILAVSMLIPLPLGGNGAAANALGYNAAQYLTLYIARAGSGFGTNLWNTFNNAFTPAAGGAAGNVQEFGMLSIGTPAAGASPASQLVGIPTADRVDPLVSFMHLAHACRAMMKRSDGRTIDAFLMRGISITGEAGVNGGPKKPDIKSYLPLKQTTTFDDARIFTQNGTLLIRFGSLTPNSDAVRPFCGEVSVTIGDLTQTGSKWLFEQNFLLIAKMWENKNIVEFGDRIAANLIPGVGNGCAVTVTEDALWGAGAQACKSFPNADYYIQIRDTYQGLFNANVVTARDKQITDVKSAIDPRILTRGWAGAGIWYNRLATVNGSLYDAAHSLPEIRSMPLPMITTLLQNSAGSKNLTKESRYELGSSTEYKEISTRYKEIAGALGQVYKYFLSDAFIKSTGNNGTGNAIYDLMNFLFGTKALFDLSKNTDINPMVQLIGLGKSITDRAIINLMGGSGLEFAGGVLAQLDDWSKIGDGILKVSDAWFSVSLIALGIGIQLYYVLSFLPFIYFFFSVIKWLQSVFEAMIGMPLWALAHIRIDGDGLPGPAAENGYFLLLEILLRPSLTIFGMVSSFILFTGMAYMLNDTFTFLRGNVSGFNNPLVNNNMTNLETMHGSVDEFFYTVLYAILIYMFALSSFKLIDRIPENILRWMGSRVRNIIDETGDPVPGLIRSTYIGAFGMPLIQRGQDGMIGQAVEGLQGAAQGSGRAIGEILNSSLRSGK